MRESLLNVLACPACNGGLRIGESLWEGESVIIEGTLICRNCTNRYPIAEGIPRLLIPTGELKRTKKQYEFQWRRYLDGKFELGDRSYGVTHGFWANLILKYILDAPEEKGTYYLLDAGCGTGRIAKEIANRRKDFEVVAMDICEPGALFKGVVCGNDNIHFVQGDVLNLPFRKETFNSVVSLGVLHHARKTERAFKEVSRLVRSGGKLVVWIYPHPSESGSPKAYLGFGWKFYYRLRDVYFLNLGHKLPTIVLYRLCWIFSALYTMYETCRPSLLRKKRRSFGQRCRRNAFVLFDNLAPPIQNRHKKDEVSRWYEDSSFAGIQFRNGLYWGTKRKKVGCAS